MFSKNNKIQLIVILILFLATYRVLFSEDINQTTEPKGNVPNLDSILDATRDNKNIEINPKDTSIRQFDTSNYFKPKTFCSFSTNLNFSLRYSELDNHYNNDVYDDGFNPLDCWGIGFNLEAYAGVYIKTNTYLAVMLSKTSGKYLSSGGTKNNIYMAGIGLTFLTPLCYINTGLAYVYRDYNFVSYDINTALIHNIDKGHSGGINFYGRINIPMFEVVELSMGLDLLISNEFLLQFQIGLSFSNFSEYFSKALGR